MVSWWVLVLAVFAAFYFGFIIAAMMCSRSRQPQQRPTTEDDPE